MRTLLTAILVLSLGTALVATPKRRPAGVVLAVSGNVTLYRSKIPAQTSPSVRMPRLGQTLFAGDRLRTGANGRVGLVLTDGTQLKLNYNTDVTLSDRNSRGNASARGIAAVKIFIGELWARVTKKDSTLEFDTPAAVAAVKGTEPLIEVGADGTFCLRLRSGAVRLTNDQPGGLLLRPNQQICLSLHQKILPSLVQVWNAGLPTWEKTFNQATSAAVTVQYVDRAGAAKSFVLNYGPAPLTTTVK